MQQIFLSNVSDIENVFRKVIQEELKNYITNLSINTSPTKKESESLITKGQLAKELKITIPTLSKMLSEKKIKYYKVGKRKRYKMSEVLVVLNNKNSY